MCIQIIHQAKLKYTPLLGWEGKEDVLNYSTTPGLKSVFKSAQNRYVRAQVQKAALRCEEALYSVLWYKCPVVEVTDTMSLQVLGCVGKAQVVSVCDTAAIICLQSNDSSNAALSYAGPWPGSMLKVEIPLASHASLSRRVVWRYHLFPGQVSIAPSPGIRLAALCDFAK